MELGNGNKVDLTCVCVVFFVRLFVLRYVYFVMEEGNGNKVDLT
jgi:hypothetical protein